MTAPSKLPGVYRIEFTTRKRRYPVGLIRLVEGEFEGWDLRSLEYRGTYSVEGARGDIVVQGEIVVPARSPLGGAVIASDAQTQIPVSLRLPAAAMDGAVVDIDISLDAAHATDATIGPVRARFERIRDV